MSDIKISVETSQTSEVQGEITVIRVDGVIDTMTASELEKVANSILEQKKYKIIIDLGGVDYISSAGWGIFISNIREIRLNDGDIKLARMIPNVYEIFELLEFDSILKAFDNVTKAKNDFITNSSATSDKLNVEETAKIPVTEKVPVDAGKTELNQKPSISMGEISSPEQTRTKNETIKEPQPIDQPAKPEPVKPQEKASGKKKHLKEVITELVSKDPFLSIGEIRKAISKQYPGTGFLKTWWMLKKMGLGSKKKRFYFARTRRIAR